MPDETMKGTSHYRLVRLDDHEELQIAEGEPDPRGWNVRTSDGRTVGRVDSLIADTGAMKIRYLDVALDGDALLLPDERHVLIPIGGATLEAREDVVRLPTLSSGTVAQLPPYRHEAMTRADEQELLRRFDGTYSTVPPADFYAHRHFSDQHFFGKRLRKREGSAYLTRSEAQFLRKERVDIETPGDSRVDDAR